MNDKTATQEKPVVNKTLGETPSAPGKGKRSSTAKKRKMSSGDLKLEVVRILTTLEGKFFFVFESEEGKTETLSNWS